MSQAAVNVPDSSPKRILVEWANEQDGWVRELARLALSTHQPPSADEVEHLFEIFLAEKGLSDGADLPSAPSLEVVDAEEAEDDTLELVRLEQVSGVNALAEGQTLDFDSGLTILFGRNGSGKTGYARVLKRLAAARTAEEILGNAAAPDTSLTPTARLTYKLGADTSEVVWQNELGLAPFTRISVFDASAVHVHVDQDIGYVYTPGELALFEHTAKGVQAVQARIEAEALRLSPDPPFRPR